MKNIFSLLAVLLLFNFVNISVGLAETPNTDTLIQKNLILKNTTDLDAILKKTEYNIKAFVDNFNIELDPGSKIVSAKQVGGTILQPVLKVSIKKCVLFVCQRIDLDAEFTLEKITGTCDYNYQLIGDLQRSSPTLTELYTKFINKICFRKDQNGDTNVLLTVDLLRADTYKSGTTQKETFKFVKLQADSLISSFSKVMKLNGVTEVIVIP